MMLSVPAAATRSGGGGGAVHAYNTRCRVRVRTAAEEAPSSPPPVKRTRRHGVASKSPIVASSRHAGGVDTHTCLDAATMRATTPDSVTSSCSGSGSSSEAAAVLHAATTTPEGASPPDEAAGAVCRDEGAATTTTPSAVAAPPSAGSGTPAAATVAADDTLQAGWWPRHILGYGTYSVVLGVSRVDAHPHAYDAATVVPCVEGKHTILFNNGRSDTDNAMQECGLRCLPEAWRDAPAAQWLRAFADVVTSAPWAMKLQTVPRAALAMTSEEFCIQLRELYLTALVGSRRGVACTDATWAAVAPIATTTELTEAHAHEVAHCARRRARALELKRTQCRSLTLTDADLTDDDILETDTPVRVPPRGTERHGALSPLLPRALGALPQCGEPWSPMEVLVVFRALVADMAQCFADFGFLHRDIKPCNIVWWVYSAALLDGFVPPPPPPSSSTAPPLWHVRVGVHLVDFGLAKVGARALDAPPTPTTTDVAAGVTPTDATAAPSPRAQPPHQDDTRQGMDCVYNYTLYWRPPEMCLEVEADDEAAEVWALGMTLLNILAGAPHAGSVLPPGTRRVCKPIHVLHWVRRHMGWPRVAEWPALRGVSRHMLVAWPEAHMPCAPAWERIAGWPGDDAPDLSHLLQRMLTVVPARRARWAEVAAHPAWRTVDTLSPEVLATLHASAACRLLADALPPACRPPPAAPCVPTAPTAPSTVVGTRARTPALRDALPPAVWPPPTGHTSVLWHSAALSTADSVAVETLIDAQRYGWHDMPDTSSTDAMRRDWYAWTQAVPPVPNVWLQLLLCREERRRAAAHDAAAAHTQLSHTSASTVVEGVIAATVRANTLFRLPRAGEKGSVTAAAEALCFVLILCNGLQARLPTAVLSAMLLCTLPLPADLQADLDAGVVLPPKEDAADRDRAAARAASWVLHVFAVFVTASALYDERHVLRYDTLLTLGNEYCATFGTLRAPITATAIRNRTLHLAAQIGAFLPVAWVRWVRAIATHDAVVTRRDLPWIGRTLWMCAVTPRLVHDTLMLLSHEEALRLLARVHDATDVAPFIVPGPAAERSIGKITSLLQDWERAGALRMILR